MKKIAVFGATGFVGATLVERLIESGDWDIVALINRPGSAWRLARLGIELTQVNVLDKAQVTKATQGCSHVVNCSRGDRAVMLEGLTNILAACQKNAVERFVHLSSVMAYGDPPLAKRETDPRLPVSERSYAGIKQAQDAMVREAADAGLSATTLIPPNISGPYSFYLTGIMGAMHQGRFALLDSGDSPVQMIDVGNLCEAILLALNADKVDANGYFVNDGSIVTWKMLTADLARIAGTDTKIPTVDRATLDADIASQAKPKIRIKRSLLHLVSSDIREALRKDPLWAKVDMMVRGWVAKMGSRVEQKMRNSIEGPISVPLRVDRQALQVPLVAQQLRDVAQSIDKARTELGYSPRYSYEQSMQAFEQWYIRLHALDSEHAALLRQLY